MNHLMIDLETLDTRPTAAFPSIAATPFNIETGEMGKPFYRTISLDSLFAAKLTVSGTTLQWWMDQNHEICKKMFRGTDHLSDVLVDLVKFVHDNDSIYFWGNSARFDLSILENGFRSVSMDIPWHYRNERDYRTYATDFKSIGYLDRPVNAHDPVVDNEYQITRLCAIWKAINSNAKAAEHESNLGMAYSLLREVTQNSSPAVAELRRRVEQFLNGAQPRNYSFENPHKSV